MPMTPFGPTPVIPNTEKALGDGAQMADSSLFDVAESAMQAVPESDEAGGIREAILDSARRRQAALSDSADLASQALSQQGAALGQSAKGMAAQRLNFARQVSAGSARGALTAVEAVQQQSDALHARQYCALRGLETAARHSVGSASRLYAEVAQAAAEGAPAEDLIQRLESEDGALRARILGLAAQLGQVRGAEDGEQVILDFRERFPENAEIPALSARLAETLAENQSTMDGMDQTMRRYRLSAEQAAALMGAARQARIDGVGRPDETVKRSMLDAMRQVVKERMTPEAAAWAAATKAKIRTSAEEATPNFDLDEHGFWMPRPEEPLA